MASPVRHSLLVACGLLMPPLSAVLADTPPPIVTSAVEVEAVDIKVLERVGPAAPFGSGRARFYPGVGPARVINGTQPRTPQGPQWVVPVGEYGLELVNGMRMVGRPSKDWTAKITTAFGVVVIPLTQIAHIAPAGNGQFSAFLTNGDRVTGSLVSNTMSFETKFGTLNIAAADIARLRSSATPTTAQPIAVTNSPARPSGASRPPAIPADARSGSIRTRRLIERFRSLRSK